MPTDRERVHQLISEGAQLVEVLPRAEYEDEHLPGTIGIPLKELDRERVQQLERARPVIVYCSRRRSGFPLGPSFPAHLRTRLETPL
jgi:rhodanese-related sulfurtransferase